MPEYKIVKAKGLKFKGENNIICEIQSGYVLEVAGFGYMSFKEANGKDGVKSPYINTRKVLKSILDQGGLVDFSNVEFLQPVQ